MSTTENEDRAATGEEPAGIPDGFTDRCNAALDKLSPVVVMLAEIYGPRPALAALLKMTDEIAQATTGRGQVMYILEGLKAVTARAEDRLAGRPVAGHEDSDPLPPEEAP